MAVSVTRLGGDAETAQPYIDRFNAQLEKNAGWPKGSLKGRFLPSKKEAISYIEAQKPGFGVLDPWLYFELRKQHKLEPLIQVEGQDLNSPVLHVIVKDPAIKSLDDLKGKRLWTTLAESPQYLGQVVLDGKEPADKRYSLKQVGAAMKAARAVLRGEADAAIVDDAQLEAAKKIEGGAALRTIYTSKPQPPVVVVQFQGTATPADKEPLVKTMLKVCGTPEGEPVCKEMHITKFVALNAALFNETQKRYDGAGASK
jgi:ABC-type phosphate/phosphonate transport system substrate-binding protein